MDATTRYAKSGDLEIAYQIVGDGDLDLVVVPGLIAHLDVNWEMYGFAAWVKRLASFSRVILFDKRGTGLSDRDVGDFTVEERMDDLRALLDAVGSKKAALIGFSEGGALSMLYAASYPERVHALVLFGSFASIHSSSSHGLQTMRDLIDSHWGEGQSLELIAPSAAKIPAAVEFMGRLERNSMSPRAGRSHLRWIREIDVRPIAQSLHVPTLVLHRSGDRLVEVDRGRWLGANIPGARYVETEGDDHPPWLGDTAPELDQLQEFLTGAPAPIETERVLATVLFTDIVGSTERAVALGDRAWSDLLERHHDTVRGELRRHRGVEQDTAGDGFLAAFDGPARAVKCAAGIRDAVRGLGLEIRAGVHTGECERVDGKLAGVAVHTGARVMSQAGPSEVLVSSTVKDLVAGSGLEFGERGVFELKGIPGEWRLFDLR